MQSIGETATFSQTVKRKYKLEQRSKILEKLYLQYLALKTRYSKLKDKKANLVNDINAGKGISTQIQKLQKEKDTIKTKEFKKFKKLDKN